MRVLIIEDELPAYERLLGFIDAEIGDCEIVGWARSVVEAKRLLEKKESIDLIFSDIELLDGNSFNIFEAIQVSCPIIFCTAFDQYLFKAFQTNGIAYLLKPYTKEHFKDAIDKYKKLFAQNATPQIDSGVMTQLKTIIEGNTNQYKKRFSIKKKSGIKIIKTKDIVCFKANGDFSFAFDVAKDKHVVSYSLGDIESKLDPNEFFRINRSEIINIDYVEKIESHFKNKLAIKIKFVEEVMYTSGAKTPGFREWIEK